jgi:hypothetical protein
MILNFLNARCGQLLLFPNIICAKGIGLPFSNMEPFWIGFSQGMGKDMGREFCGS